MYFKLHDLETITNNFSEENRIGSGGYGDVYRGVYRGEDIALKKLRNDLQGIDDKAFDNEFRNLANIQHENVVRLLGYCYESTEKFVHHNGELVRAKEKERVLCFQYMQGGSLDKHISDESCDLDWPTCYQIIKGTSQGLNHLHSSQEKPIYHMDLKPANILLDKNMVAKIADLGLSRLVASTVTHRTEMIRGTEGYMPPEYVNGGAITRKFDVFSLGVIIIKILAGNKGYSRLYEISPEQFIEDVTDGIWKTKLHAMSRSSQEIEVLRVKTCVEIALRCVDADRNKRPYIKDIVQKLDELDLEAEIKKMSLSSDQSKCLIGQSCDSNILAVDPTLELRFLFEPGKDISCCLQLTNKTTGSIAYNIKINKARYSAKPDRGIMPPCSKRYVSVMLRAQQEAPPNMQCNDMFLVQSVGVDEGQASAGEITRDFFEKVMAEKVMDTVKLPIVYLAPNQF